MCRNEVHQLKIMQTVSVVATLTFGDANPEIISSANSSFKEDCILEDQSGSCETFLATRTARTFEKKEQIIDHVDGPKSLEDRLAVATIIDVKYVSKLSRFVSCQSCHKKVTEINLQSKTIKCTLANCKRDASLQLTVITSDEEKLTLKFFIEEHKLSGCTSSSSATVDCPQQPSVDGDFASVTGRGPTGVYQKRKLREEKAWEDMRDKLKTAFFNQQFLPKTTHCKECIENGMHHPRKAVCHCQDCGWHQYLCLECAIALHSRSNMFHILELWKDGKFRPMFANNFNVVVPGHEKCGSYKDIKSITFIDLQGTVVATIFIS
eukprot:gene8391-9290_t